MHIVNGAHKIGRLNYAHWTGKPSLPFTHDLALVPQSVADGWDAFCSCGEWRAFQHFMPDGPLTSRDGVIAALTDAHHEHKAVRR